MSSEITPERPYSELRQEQRLADAPALYRQQHERLALELALHMEEPNEVFARHHYTVEQAAELLDSPAFIALLERATTEVREQGLSFKVKAKAISEEALPYAWEMMSDPTCSAAVRADLIKWSATVAGHNPKPDKDEGKSGGGLTLSITFAGQPPQQVVSAHEVVTIEQEG